PRFDATRPLIRYSAAIVLAFLAMLLRLSVDPWVGDQYPFATFIAAAAISAWFGGAGPALLTLVLGYLLADWFFISPRHELNISGLTRDQAIASALFFGLSLIIVSLSALTQAARNRAEAAANKSTEQNRLLITESAQRKDAED